MKSEHQRETHPQQSAGDLTGQVAIVTGGGRGIGRAIAQELARTGMAVAARTAEEINETVALIEASGGTVRAFAVDVTDADAVRQMAEGVDQALGPVDLLVNNVGVFGPFAPIWETDPDAWWRCMDVNLRGPFLCARFVAPGMIQRQRGRIVNVSTGAALGPLPNATAYGISKTALLRLTESLAAAGEAFGVRAFTINPGMVRTEMTEEIDRILRSDQGQTWAPGHPGMFASGDGAPPTRAAQLVRTLATGVADDLSGCYISIDDDLPTMIEQRRAAGDLYTLRLRQPRQ